MTTRSIVVSIKDTVHGYIEVDPLERRVIDTPWFQRLKQVRQNDVSSTVYPTMHTRRFEHSLGAMHVSGACMSAALQNSTTDNRRKFLEALWKDLFGGSFNDEKASDAAVAIARLHGALHDIGHPPFSHLIERSISYASIYPGRPGVPEKVKKWHELNGVDIINEKIITVAQTDEERLYLATVGKLLSGNGLTPALKGVQSLVDAVIDTDRMDFVARDGQASGSEFGHYGLARLIDSFQIVVDQIGADIAAVHIRPSIKALSAVESLLLERHKLYRWVFFHHRVMLAKALTREVIGWLSNGLRAEKLDATDYQVENYYSLLPTKPYGLLGDSYVEAQLWRVLKALGSAAATDIEKRARAALRVLLLRERMALALWKNRDEYESFDRRLAERFRKLTTPPDPHLIARKHGSYANWLGDYLIKHSDRARGFFELASERLFAANKGWFLIEATEGFSTKGKDEIITAAGSQAASLGQFSSVVRGVEESWRDDVHLYAFFVSVDGPLDGTTPNRDAYREHLAEALVDVFREDGGEQKKLRGFLESG